MTTNRKLEKIRDGLKLKGMARFFHHLFMLITYPIRKPLYFIPILALLYLVPTFIGAKPTEVHIWYLEKIKENTSGIRDFINDKVQTLKPMVDNIDFSGVKDILPQEKPIKQVVDVPQNTPQSSMRRRMFEKASEKTEAIDVLKNAPIVRVQPAIKKNIPAQDIRQNFEGQRQLSEAQKKLPLIYADVEEEISGTVKVKTANEIELDGVSYFFYGIYVDPNSKNGMIARNFLQKLVGDNVIKCRVIAYTYQDVGTVRCYVNGEEINRTMVEQGYSRNVALDI